MSDIYVNIDAGYYSPKFGLLVAPPQPLKPQWRPKQTKAEHLADIETYETAEAQYQTAKQAYDFERERRSALCSARHAEFKRDVFALYDIAEHPKAERLFAMAWERGHSSGYADVLNCVEDLVELIRD